MSDLISRSELIEEIKSLQITLGGKNIFLDEAKDTILRTIIEQPTAYDIGKVVEELEELPKCSTWNHNSDNVDRKKAIEIVKHGGVGKGVE